MGTIHDYDPQRESIIPPDLTKGEKPQKTFATCDFSSPSIKRARLHFPYEKALTGISLSCYNRTVHYDTFVKERK